MFAFGIVELQRPSHRVQHALGRARQVPALEARVVVDADAGQQGDLLAAQPGDAALARRSSAVRHCSGVIRARRDVRKSRMSLRWSTNSRLRACHTGLEGYCHYLEQTVTASPQETDVDWGP